VEIKRNCHETLVEIDRGRLMAKLKSRHRNKIDPFPCPDKKLMAREQTASKILLLTKVNNRYQSGS
jgi:hypothetical protein